MAAVASCENAALILITLRMEMLQSREFQNLFLFSYKTCTAENQIFSKYILVVEDLYPFWFVIKTISTSSENPQSWTKVHFWKIVTNSKIKRKPSSTSSHSSTTAGLNSLKWTRTKDAYGLFLITCFCHRSVRSGDFQLRTTSQKKYAMYVWNSLWQNNHMVVYSDLSNINEVRS